MCRDECIVVSRHDEAQQHPDHPQDRENEAGNHHRIVTECVELREGEAEDDGEDRTTDVSKKDGHEGGDTPILAATDDKVEVATKLVAL